MIGTSQSFRDSILKPNEHPTRVWCTADEHELTVVQDGKAGIKVLSLPLDVVRAKLD